MNQEFLYSTNLLYIFPGLIIFFIATTTLCYFIASRRKKFEQTVEAGANDLLPTTILGLLALLLGFTFSMSITRFDQRNSLVVREANAIGTAYLRSDAFPIEQGNKYKEILKAYTLHRLSYFDKIQTETAEYLNKTQQLQSQIWRQTIIMIADKTPIASAFMQANNELIDIDSERTFSSENHVPEIVFYVLIFITAFGLCTLSYNLGLRRQRLSTPLILSILFSIVIVLIQDLDRPGRGLIQAKEESLMRAYEGIR